MENVLTLGAWFYLKEGNRVTPPLVELVCWHLIAQGVLDVRVEKSPVKSEGEILYVRPGLHFSNVLSPLEEMYRLPFQTRVAPRLKWTNYSRQILNILKNQSTLEKEYILPELEKTGLLKLSWWDKLTGKRKISWTEGESFVFFNSLVQSAWKQKEQNLPYLSENEWKIP